MQRQVMTTLQGWRDGDYERMLFLYGTYGVGKTWIVRKFLEESSEEYIYISVKDICKDVNLAYGDATIFVIDDIDDGERLSLARRIILRIRGDANLPEYRFILIGSMVDKEFYGGELVDEEYIKAVRICPLSFAEFYEAISGKYNVDIYNIFKLYLIVGGMPECVNVFLQTGDTKRVRDVQKSILHKISERLSKDKRIIYKRSMEIIESLWQQVEKEGAGFSLRQINPHAREREYGYILRTLENYGVVKKISRYESEHRQGYKDYKLYLFDVGLMGAMSNIDESTVGDGDVLIKAFLIQEFYAYDLDRLFELYYWHKARAKAKLPILLRSRETGEIILLDISGVHNHMRSISSFREKHRVDAVYKLHVGNKKKYSYDSFINHSDSQPCIREEHIYNTYTTYRDIKDNMRNHNSKGIE